MDFVEYREKLGIGFEDNELNTLFFNRIFNMLNNLEQMDYQISAQEYYNFCWLTGSRLEMHRGSTYYSIQYWENIISLSNINIYSLNIFLSYYLYFIKCQKDNEDKKCNKQFFLDLLCDCLKESHIPFELIEDGGDSFVFPKGAKELDDALVSQPLEWLNNYPKARKTYITALKQYSDGIYIRDTADNLRKALETFLQEFLGNTKNLKNNIIEICSYLGKQGVDAGVIGMFQTLINSYKKINDSNVKHNDKIDAKLLEFLLYQTGVFIRMIIKNAEKKEQD